MAEIKNIVPKADAVVEEFDLQNGSEKITVGFIDARGKHITKAQRLMGGEEDKYYPALMHVVCRVNGSIMPIEYYEDLRMHPFSAIMVRLNTEGFTDSAKQK